LLDLYCPQAATDVRDPRTLEERRHVAGRFDAAIKSDIPMLVDDLDDAVNKAYAAQPTRLYLLDPTGSVAYAGGLGPFGFKPAELGTAIETQLAKPPHP